ncbi:protocadherin-16 [Biomphalaria glabrata]|nr:protocadherin-16 [Biomphalaria glabrata]
MRLDSSTGQLYLVKQYDLDTGAAAYLSLVVTASDGTHTTVMDVQIVFVFVNEFDPVFTSSPSANVQENSPSGTTITTVLATDRDKGQDGQITYSLVPLPDSTFFLIGATTGVITLNCNKCLDYASRSGYVLVVKAEDGGSPPRLSLQSLTINVTQTTFSEPRFKQQLYNFQVVENSVNYFQLDASDLDTPRSLLVFTNAAPNIPADSPFYANVFPNGTLRISSLDAEKISSMTFGASVTDGVTKDTAVIIVNVTDVNDNDPVPVLQSPISVFENAQSGQSVSVVSATDADISNAGFTFYIETGTDGKFEINSSTGLITTSGQFDRRLKSFYNFSVNVLDHGSPPRSASKFLVVNIVDSNTAPIFVKDLTSRQEVARYSFNISEDRPVGTKVGSLYAYDPDFGSSGQLKYSISFQEPINTFVLDSTDGQLTLNRILNYEIKNNYNLIVMVSDNSYEPKTATSTVNINVDNVVESPEWPLPLPVIYFTQSTPCDPQVEALSQEVTTLSIHGDEGVEYKLLNHTDQFSINSTTGNLQVTTSSLSEGDYIVGLTACAKGSTVCSNASLTIKVSVSSGLTFCPAFVTLLVNESSRVNELLHDLSTNKGDAGVQYTITSGNAEGKFRINSTDGKLYINGLLDRETASQYVLTVSALRLSTKETANAQIIIYILDSPDTPPRFQLPVYLGEISESETVGTPVKLSESSTPLIVQATDEDLNTKLTYSIGPVNDTSLGSFSVNPDSGAITLAKSVDFDTMASSLNQMYSFLVLVSDGLFQASTQVHIKILDANDHSPVFTDPSDPILVKVMENEVISKNILSVVATDTDSIDSGKLEYSLALVSPSGQGNPFKVDSTTGNIVLDHTLDREVVDEYLLNITVTDVAGHKAVKQVRITVGDVNDNGPYFINTTYLMNVTEDRGLRISATPSEIIVGRTPSLVINCSFSHPPTQTSHLASIVLYSMTAGAPMKEILSANTFTPLTVAKYVDLQSGFVYKTMYDDVSMTSYIALRWNYPNHQTTVYTCEANTLDNYDRPEKFTSSIEVVKKGQVSINDLLKELQALGNKLFNVAINSSSALEGHCSEVLHQLKEENLMYRDLIYYVSDPHQGNRFYLRKVSDCAGSNPSARKAFQMCETMGGHLARIENGQQFAFIQNFLKSKIDFETTVLISGHDEERFDHWVYHGTDQSLLYYDWASPEPYGHSVDGKHCIVLGWAGFDLKMYSRPAGIGSSLALEAVDKDNASNAEILYYILSGNEGKYFDIIISGNKSLLRTVKVFDREELNRQGVASLSVLVKAANLDNNWNYVSSSTCTVLVTVLDVNDNSPVFNANSYTGQVLESVTFNTLIPLVSSYFDIDDSYAS